MYWNRVLHARLEIFVRERLPQTCLTSLTYINVRQGHTVEGVCLHHRIYRHVAEDDGIALVQLVGKGVCADYITAQTGRTAETVGVTLTALKGRKDWRGVGHLYDIGRMTCRRHVEDDIRDAVSAAGLHLKHGGMELAGIKRDSLAGFEIDVEMIGLADVADASLEERDVIVGAGDVMSAAEVEPPQPVEICAELLFDSIECRLQIVGVLLAKRVEVQTVDDGREIADTFGRKIAAEVGERGAEARAGGAGIVDGMTLLGGAFGIDAEADLQPCLAQTACIAVQLLRTVEHDMVADGLQNGDVILAECGREDVILLARHLFVTEARLINAARRRPGKVSGDEGIESVAAEAFLREENL